MVEFTPAQAAALQTMSISKLKVMQNQEHYLPNKYKIKFAILYKKCINLGATESDACNIAKYLLG